MLILININIQDILMDLKHAFPCLMVVGLSNGNVIISVVDVNSSEHIDNSKKYLNS